MTSRELDEPGPSGSKNDGKSVRLHNGALVKVSIGKASSSKPCSDHASYASYREPVVLKYNSHLKTVRPCTKSTKNSNRAGTSFPIIIKKGELYRFDDDSSPASQGLIPLRKERKTHSMIQPPLRTPPNMSARKRASAAAAQRMRRIESLRAYNTRMGRVAVIAQRPVSREIYHPPRVLENHGMVSEDVKAEVTPPTDSDRVYGPASTSTDPVQAIPHEHNACIIYHPPRVLENHGMVSEDVKAEVTPPTDSDRVYGASTSTNPVQAVPHEHDTCGLSSPNLFENGGMICANDMKIESPTDSVDIYGSASTSYMPGQAVPHQQTDGKNLPLNVLDNRGQVCVEDVKTEVYPMKDSVMEKGLFSTSSMPVQTIPHEHIDCNVCGVTMRTPLLRGLHELHTNGMSWVCLHCGHSDKTEVEAVQHYYNTHIQAARQEDTGEEFIPIIYDLKCPIPSCYVQNSFIHPSIWKAHLATQHSILLKYNAWCCSSKFCTNPARSKHDHEHELFLNNTGMEGKCCPLCGISNQWSMKSETGHSMSHMAVHGLQKISICRYCLVSCSDDVDNHHIHTHFAKNHCTRFPSHILCNICRINVKPNMLKKHVVSKHVVRGYKARKGATGRLKIQIDGETSLFLGFPNSNIGEKNILRQIDHSYIYKNDHRE